MIQLKLMKIIIYEADNARYRYDTTPLALQRQMTILFSLLTTIHIYLIKDDNGYKIIIDGLGCQ